MYTSQTPITRLGLCEGDGCSTGTGCVWAQSEHEVVFVRRDMKSVWRMRGDAALEGGKVWGVWACGRGEEHGEGIEDDGPPCVLLLMIVGGRVVVLASSSLGFCHELLQYVHVRGVDV